MEFNLDKMNIGDRGKVIDVKGQGAVRRKLLDLGITPNTEVQVRKKAPLGDPIEITLRGFELTLRREDARNIVVEEIV